MPQILSHYRLEDEIGRGGMGVVYRALDTRLGRQVAIKVLPPEATADPERRRRFIQEARAASALNHPNIVTIHEVDEHDGTTFIAMELVDGTPLDRRLAAGPVPVADALAYAVQIAAALHAAHGAGIVHRDMKPGNMVVTPDGRVKVLDFGLAKLIERPASEETLSGMNTMPGTIVGTAAYMAPEQAQGEAVDARADIFSFGAVLYEMLAGRRPFTGPSDVHVLSAILRDEPPALRTIRHGIPADVEAAVERALRKNPADRYQTAGDFGTDLAAAHARLTRVPDAPWRRRAVLVPVALLLVVIAAAAAWQVQQMRGASWARRDAIPEIERLQSGGRSMAAVRVAREAERYVPEEIARLRAGWLPFKVTTEPAGADIAVRNYADMDGEWEPLGSSPIGNAVLPFAYYRVRVTKPGYKALEVSAVLGRSPIRLTPDAESAPPMVFVPGGLFATGQAPPVTLPDFWIDQREVTNAAYKAFVDAGGYRDEKYWKEPFTDKGRVLPFAEAMARMRDSTGQAGPLLWEYGSFPDGRAEYPVDGISWFEAAAYAEFTGKSLPTIYHWFRAAGTSEPYSDILLLSNFDGKGPSKAGERAGVGPWGTFDMAGNVKEWCLNDVSGRGLRYILGGGWNEPRYRFVDPDAQDPWERRSTFGMRLVKNLGDAAAAAAPVASVTADPSTVVPVSDDLFTVYKRFYEYDRTPLNAKVEAIDDSSPHWRKEKVTFAAAYGNERVPAYLFLPKDVKPPYQTVVLFPSSYAQSVPSSATLDLATFEFIMRSGRALLYPVYQGTYERIPNAQATPTGTRDKHVQWAKDFFRAVDYLETRPEIDMARLAYHSLSMGAYFGPIPVALEPRIKAAVFAAGGLRYNFPPETQPANFAPRIKVPVLLVNGRDDFQVPLAEQQRYFALIGTPADRKKHVVLDGGHVPQDMRALFREVLDWLDLQFGPVNK